LNKRITLA